MHPVVKAIFKAIFAEIFLLVSSMIITPSASAEPLLIMAASSLTNVLPEVARAWKAQGAQGSQEVSFSFESTSRLAQQITAGAPGDVFFSADRAWMDQVEKVGKIDKETRVTLLSNRIVLVVSADSSFAPTSAAALLDPHLKHLALAGEAVPAGRFARAALKTNGVLAKLQDRIVNAENVRGALLWVARKEAEAGIVFETDARIEPGVKTAFVFPESSHPKIEYSASVIHGTKHPRASRLFLEFCKSAAAKKLFVAAGFR